MTSLPPLVGVGGKLRHGKDVVADRLVAAHRYTKVNMSDEIHRLMSLLNPLVPVRVFGVFTIHRRYVEHCQKVGFTDAKSNPEVRRLLQIFGGTIVRDEIDSEFWVSAVKRRIAQLRRNGSAVVLSGVRFPNECDIIRDAGGSLVWVHRPGLDADASISADQTENSVSADDFDVTLLNNSTVSALERSVDRHAATLLVHTSESAEAAA